MFVYLSLLYFVYACIVALACVIVLLLLRFSTLVCGFGFMLIFDWLEFSFGIWIGLLVLNVVLVVCVGETLFVVDGWVIC